MGSAGGRMRWPLWLGFGGLVLALVSRMPWWQGSAGGTLVHPGVGLDALAEHGGWLGMSALAVALLAGAAHARRSGGAVAPLVVGAVAAALAAAWLGMAAAVSHPMHRQYARFDAPDGAAYLLYGDDRESGTVAVYEGGPVVWRGVPSVGGGGRASVTPGSLPCRGSATATQVVVACESGVAPRTYPR